jgi:L-galactose dehydrogenase
MGLLREGDPPLWHPAPSRLRDYARRAAQLCRRRGGDIARVALQFSVAPREFATTVVGCASVATMVRNVRWATEPLDEELVNEIEALVAPVLNTSWQTGRPENSDPRMVVG